MWDIILKIFKKFNPMKIKPHFVTIVGTVTLSGVINTLLPTYAATINVTGITTGTLVVGPSSTVNGITYLNEILPIQAIQTGTTD